MTMQPKHLASMLEGMTKALRSTARLSQYLDRDCQKAHDIGWLRNLSLRTAFRLRIRLSIPSSRRSARPRTR